MTYPSPSASSGSSSPRSPSPSGSAPSPAASASSATFSADLDPRDGAIADMVGALRRCERLAAELFAEQGRLAQAAIGAETAMGLSAVASQAILHQLGEAQSGIVGVRGHLVVSHRQLERLGRQLGVDVVMFGDAGKPPTNDPFTTACDVLQVEG